MIFFGQKIEKKYFRLFRWLRLILLGLLISVLVIPLTATAYIGLMTNGIRYIKPEEVPLERLAMVFGAGLLANGKPTPMLADRIEAGVKLYQIGRVKKLLMTGDNSTVSYNEVRSMQQYAHDLGVPMKDITLDYAGFSTYESCYRAHKIFGLHKAVVITQNYHLPRAIYTCRQFGLDTVGLGTPDIEIYGLWEMIPDLRREMLANVKALWEVHVTRPRPTFLGRFEKI
ncbi:YdcF family protein [Scytonema hofmannii FACHB-248]|uniref:YdcF family protein n=1 Tax=Scytonema hofmannii FACHB-248 TaxID=1842502 RepID=A0ABR8GQV8_9CYAN|nr:MULTISPECIES: ElyC/SanA/YdcF family protein [Nostocales]MBD2605733.1 YdcF family protein [Scytonema hofmannii FACHB-248]